MQGRLSIVVGGNFGSEAKGHLTGDLTSADANNDQHVVCVRPGAHQAGHTVVGGDGRRWALRQVPVAAVTNLTADLYIAAGSEVSHDTLLDEVRQLDEAGYKVSDRLIIDRSATWLTDEHIEMETPEKELKTGSTRKGVGAARSERIWRRAELIEKCPLIPSAWLHSDTGTMMAEQLRAGAHLVVEGVQGYGLGLHTEFYPNTTSGDCRAIDFLAQCGISPWSAGVPTPDVWVVIRPYPIRIAGASGPLKGETSWKALGLPEEITTVTKKTRRVGEWDPDLVRDAVRANGGNVKIAFAMADQVLPDLTDQTGLLEDWLDHPGLLMWFDRIEKAAGDGSTVHWVGTGPNTHLEWGPRVRPASAITDYGVLENWWLGTSRNDFESVILKAVQYGSNSLQEMGHKLAQLNGRKVTDAEAQELACWFYATSKVERWTDAVMRGDRPSDDTILDAEVYLKMARRIRQAGGWPSG